MSSLFFTIIKYDLLLNTAIAAKAKLFHYHDPCKDHTFIRS